MSHLIKICAVCKFSNLIYLSLVLNELISFLLLQIQYSTGKKKKLPNDVSLKFCFLFHQTMSIWVLLPGVPV